MCMPFKMMKSGSTLAKQTVCTSGLSVTMLAKSNQREVAGHGITSKPSASILGRMHDILSGSLRSLVAGGQSGFLVKTAVGATRRREGAERATNTEFARFLDIAKGSSGEVRSMYRLAQRLKLIESSVVDERCGQCKSISRQLGGFAKYLRQTKK
jgi:hypothetical protein